MREHRFGKFAAVMAMAGAAVLAAGATAQASPTGAAEASNAAPSACAVPNPGSIQVVGSVGIGVAHLEYCHVYDAILQPGQDTYHTLGWKEAASAYFGPGFTAHWYVKGKPGLFCDPGGFSLQAGGGGNWVVWADKGPCP